MNQDNFGVSTDFRQRMSYGILPSFTPGHDFRHLGKTVWDYDVIETVLSIRFWDRKDDFLYHGRRLQHT